MTQQDVKKLLQEEFYPPEVEEAPTEVDENILKPKLEKKRCK